MALVPPTMLLVKVESVINSVLVEITVGENLNHVPVYFQDAVPEQVETRQREEMDKFKGRFKPILNTSNSMDKIKIIQIMGQTAN